MGPLNLLSFVFVLFIVLLINRLKYALQYKAKASQIILIQASNGKDLSDD